MIVIIRDKEDVITNVYDGVISLSLEETNKHDSDVKSNWTYNYRFNFSNEVDIANRTPLIKHAVNIEVR